MSISNELQIYKNSKINEFTNSFNNKIKEYNSILLSNLSNIQNSKKNSTNKNIQKNLLISEYNKSVNDLKKN